MGVVLEADAFDDDAGGQEEGAWQGGGEAGFGLGDAVVSAGGELGRLLAGALRHRKGKTRGRRVLAE